MATMKCNVPLLPLGIGKAGNVALLSGYKKEVQQGKAVGVTAGPGGRKGRGSKSSRLELVELGRGVDVVLLEVACTVPNITSRWYQALC